MRAAVLAGPRAFRLETVRDPTVGAGEVLVRVGAAGICGTDYRIWTGERRVRYPLIPGHEFIGVTNHPGAMALTWTLWRAHSTASARVSARSPPFDAL